MSDSNFPNVTVSSTSIDEAMTSAVDLAKNAVAGGGHFVFIITSPINEDGNIFITPITNVPLFDLPELLRAYADNLDVATTPQGEAS